MIGPVCAPLAPCPAPSQMPQRGAALLLAMLLVVLVAVVCTGLLDQQKRSIDAEIAQRSQQQARWLLAAARDWAGLILKEDRRDVDHLGEVWALGLQETSLSAFVKGGNSAFETAALPEDVFLSGHIEDAQSRLNIYNLAVASDKNDASYQSFAKLFAYLHCPAEELAQLHQNLHWAVLGQAPGGGAGAANVVANVGSSNANTTIAANTTNIVNAAVSTGDAAADPPLPPRSVADLTRLGLGPTALSAILPYITYLPQRSTLNINTADAVALYASVPNLTLADAQSLVNLRQTAAFQNLPQANQAIGRVLPVLVETKHSVNSEYFVVNATLRMAGLSLGEVSLLYRPYGGAGVGVVWSRVGW